MLESLNDPVAVKDNCVPSAIDVIEGATEIDTIVAFVTVKLIEELCTPSAAVIVVRPGLTLCARPVD